MTLLLLSLCLASIGQAQTNNSIGLQQEDLFVGGQEGYRAFRIPSLIVTKRGSALAFCEGRKNGAGDSGDVDVIFKRSTDQGKTWSSMRVIWDDGANTCGNPCAVVDETSGTILLLLTHNLGTDTEARIKSQTSQASRTVWISRSVDDGQTWSSPAEITKEVKRDSWTWYATGPGVGVQLRHGPHSERLVIPCDFVEGSVMGSHLIYSDDHGASWKIGGTIQPGMNECQIVELADGQGTLLMNMRSYRGKSRRAQAWSRDGGLSWSEAKDHAELIEPVCQASILRFRWPQGSSSGLILFSNPADEKRRRNLTVRMSEDDGQTWPVARTLNAGWSGYSCLAVFPGKTMACLYERGETNASQKISFALFDEIWLRSRSEK